MCAGTGRYTRYVGHPVWRLSDQEAVQIECPLCSGARELTEMELKEARSWRGLLKVLTKLRAS
jgi:hypothetical protein